MFMFTSASRLLHRCSTVFGEYKIRQEYNKSLYMTSLLIGRYYPAKPQDNSYNTTNNTLKTIVRST